MILVALCSTLAVTGNQVVTQDIPFIKIPLNVFVYLAIILSSVQLILGTIAKAATKGRLLDMFWDLAQLCYLNVGFAILVLNRSLPILIEQPKYLFFIWAVLQSRLTVG